MDSSHRRALHKALGELEQLEDAKREAWNVVVSSHFSMKQKNGDEVNAYAREAFANAILGERWGDIVRSAEATLQRQLDDKRREVERLLQKGTK